MDHLSSPDQALLRSKSYEGRVLLHLTLIPGIGSAIVERLLLHLSIDQFEQLYACSRQTLRQWGVSEQAAEKIKIGLADTALLQKELDRLERYQIRFVSAFHEEYPFLLKQIHLPPLGLYVRGRLPSDYTRSLAVVGSRQANRYAQQVIEHIVPVLAREDWTIVSGGAVGADTMAHQETLKVQGTTIAIIGSGLLNPYPASNKKLFDQIVAQGGAVISPFPLTMQGLPQNFPARNRIIAGMTRGCLVVQAAEKSGALITAEIALKEGREVFAVPGSLFDPLSAGCHRLLVEGAGTVRSADDIMHGCGFSGIARVNFAHAELSRNMKCATSFDGAQDERFSEPSSTLPPLVQFCKEPRSIDALLEFEKCLPSELYDRLWEYQVAGLLQETSAGMWQAR